MNFRKYILAFSMLSMALIGCGEKKAPEEAVASSNQTAVEKKWTVII